MSSKLKFYFQFNNIALLSAGPGSDLQLFSISAIGMLHILPSKFGY